MSISYPELGSYTERRDWVVFRIKREIKSKIEYVIPKGRKEVGKIDLFFSVFNGRGVRGE